MVTGESAGRSRKSVWFDICHTPQYNFYKNFIIRLAEEGHVVYLTVLDRGKMPLIVRKELAAYPAIKIYVIGRHRLAKWSAIVDANLIRIVKLFLWSLDKRIDIAYSNAFLSSVIGRVRGFHSYTFDDDPQTFDFRPKIWFSKISHYCLYELPPGYVLSSKVKVLPALKEWAYLAPNVFTPDRIFLYNPQIQISVVSGTKRSIFRQKNKTKRSKKRLHTTLIKPEQKVNEDLCSGFIVS